MKNKSLISFTALLAIAGSTVAAGKTNEATRAPVLKLYSATPAAFIENVGQIADPTVRYAFYGSGANIFHTTKGPVFQLFQREKLAQEGNQAPDERADFRNRHRPPVTDKEKFITRSCPFSIKFLGAKQVEPTGVDKEQTKVNYFIGSDPSRWHTNLATYSKVVYPQLYDGIDLHTFGRRSHLKYQFHVAPGADHAQIVIGYEGIEGLSIDADGTLHIRTPLGELVDDAPYIYQIINGQQVQISGKYHLLNDRYYTFQVTGKVDPTKELVIDPHIDWSAYLGGRKPDWPCGIAVDASGDALLTGVTFSPDFPEAGDPCGYDDAFVAKVSSSGDLLWATYLGGSEADDCGYGIAVDAGSCLVTGITWSSDFPTRYAFQSNPGGGFHDAFVTRLTAWGDVVWSSYLGGSRGEQGYGIAVDDSGNTLVTGLTNSDNLDRAANSRNDYDDGFVAMVTPQPALCWSYYLGGSRYDRGDAIAVGVDAGGGLPVPVPYLLVTGTTDSSDFPAFGGFDNSYCGELDAFVARLNYDPNADPYQPVEVVKPALAWASYLGGTRREYGHDIAISNTDLEDYALLTGLTSSDNFPTPGGFDPDRAD